MEHHEDPVRPGTDSPVDTAFAEIVRALTVDDPRFVRRAVRRASGGSGNLAIVAGVIATLVLGVLPLVVGLQTGVAALLVAGAIGCVVLPVAVPLMSLRLV